MRSAFDVYQALRVPHYGLLCLLNHVLTSPTTIPLQVLKQRGRLMCLQIDLGKYRFVLPLSFN